MSDPIRAALERFVAMADMDLICPENPAETDWGAVNSALAEARAALAKPQGDDQDILEIFYEAKRSECGSEDEVNLRGIKAVLAHALQAVVDNLASLDDDGDLMLDASKVIAVATELENFNG